MVQSRSHIEKPLINYRARLISGRVDFSKMKTVIFDMDGTLTLPGQIDFDKIKQILGVPADKRILEYIDSIQDLDEQ